MELRIRDLKQEKLKYSRYRDFRKNDDEFKKLKDWVVAKYGKEALHEFFDYINK